MIKKTEKTNKEIAKQKLDDCKKFEVMAQTEGGILFAGQMKDDVLATIDELSKYNEPDFNPIPLCARLTERLSILREFTGAKSNTEAAREVLKLESESAN